MAAVNFYASRNRLEHAHQLGEKAKRNGWARTSPFYDDPLMDKYFFGGFDGVKVEDVEKEDYAANRTEAKTRL